jgi:hypothetical protein
MPSYGPTTRLAIQDAVAEPQGDASTLPTDVPCLAVLRGNGVIAHDPADGVRLRLLWRAQRRRAVSLWSWKPNEPISDTTVASSQG